MLHNFVVTYLDNRGVLKKDYVESKKDGEEAIAHIRQTKRVKQILSAIVEVTY